MITNPLTPFWFFVTTFFEIGLGAATYFGFIYILPLVRKWADPTQSITRGIVTSPNPIVWVFKPLAYQKGPSIHKVVSKSQPVHLKSYFLWLGAQGVAWIILLGVTGDLVFSKGWVNPLSLSGLRFDLIFARANVAPNSAHLMDYLAIPVLALVVAYKYRDVFLGLLSAAFLVAVHELIWIPAYYLAYWQYYISEDFTDVLKDISFTVMLVLFVATFIRYKYQKIPLGVFKWPIIAYVIFTVGWFFIPHLANPYYGWLPVTVLSNFNPVIGQTVYNLAPWYNDPLTAVLEEVSWLMLAGSFILVILRLKK